MAGQTIENPVTWDMARGSSNIVGGDVLILADGTYAGGVVSFSGEDGNPVIVRPQNPGKVLFNGAVSITGTNIEFCDIDFKDANPNRRLETQGVNVVTGKVSFFGCLFQDNHQSGLGWGGNGAAEVSECIFLNNGEIDPDGSYHGHALYAFNDLGGARLIARNLFFDQFGDYALHIYADSNRLQDFTCEDNITCGHPTHTGGPHALTNFIYQRNVQYGQFIQHGRYTYTAQNDTAQIIDNVSFDLDGYSINANSSNPWLNLTESGNTVYGGQPASREGYTVLDKPATWTRVIPFTKSQRWVASVAIYNRDSAATVSVDFTGLANGNYVFRNGQNPAETSAFTYSGGSVDVPTNWTAAQRLGDSTPTTTWPVFGHLVVEKA